MIGSKPLEDPSDEIQAGILAGWIIKDHHQSHRPIEVVRMAYLGTSKNGPMWDRVKFLISQRMKRQ